MIVVNADDWGRSVADTDAALECHRLGRIGSASAMVFMRDSARAAALALEAGLDVGLHLNWSEPYDAAPPGSPLSERLARIRAFFATNRLAWALYNPLLRQDFEYLYRAQADEFERLYGRAPPSVDGHHHLHLCGNVVFGRVVPRGMRLRGHFSFTPGEKGAFNRAYRALGNRLLARRYRLVDHFFGLSHVLRRDGLDGVFELARDDVVELMVHPVDADQRVCLLGDAYARRLQRVTLIGRAQS